MNREYVANVVLIVALVALCCAFIVFSSPSREEADRKIRSWVAAHGPCLQRHHKAGHIRCRAIQKCEEASGKPYPGTTICISVPGK